jgi:hypothetical protein
MSLSFSSLMSFPDITIIIIGTGIIGTGLITLLKLVLFNPHQIFIEYKNGHEDLLMEKLELSRAD